MKRVVPLAMALLVASCAHTPSPSRRTAVRRVFWLPLYATDRDVFCIPAKPVDDCRSVGEVRAFMASARADD